MKKLDRVFALIINFVEKTFPEYPSILSLWKEDMEILTSRSDYNPSTSFKAFLNCIEKISRENNLEIRDLDRWLFKYQKEIRNDIVNYVKYDYDYKNSYGNREIVTSILDKSFVRSSSALLFNRLRESISKNDFENSKGVPTLEINESSFKAVAQVRNQNPSVGLNAQSLEIQQWKQLAADAISSMDDLTADIFDIVAILWMNKAVHKEQMINFHTDDALNLRKIRGRNNVEGYQTGYRAKDRYEVMKRLAALTSIYIKVEQDRLKLIELSDNDGNTIVDSYDMVQFNPLFVVDNFTVIYRNGEPIGINECSIRPGNLLASFLLDSKEHSGLLAVKALQYHPVNQKYPKRLARYLTWHWIMNQNEQNNFLYPIGTDKGLLNVMGISINSRRGSYIKEKFEDALETLQNDNIIEKWEYINWSEQDIDENRYNWFEGSWINAKVRIIPPIKVFESIDNINGIKESQYKYVLQELVSDEYKKDEKTITPEIFKATRKERKQTLKEIGQELGISHSTLSRFERGIIKNPSEENLRKLEEWLNKK